MAEPLEQVARCVSCSWEYHGRKAYAEAQQHLEENPEHHAYSNATPAMRTEKSGPTTT